MRESEESRIWGEKYCDKKGGGRDNLAVIPACIMKKSNNQITYFRYLREIIEKSDE